jgi:hypothetical protein
MPISTTKVVPISLTTKRLSDLQKDVNQLKNEKFRPRKFDNIPRFNDGRGQVYGQNYGRGQGYGHNFGRGDGLTSCI